MALKLKIAKLEDVPEAVRGEYEPDGDGFRLKVEGMEDTSGLKAKNAELLTELKTEKETRRKKEEEAAKKSGDLEALEASWKAKHEGEIKAKEDEIKQRDGMLHKMTVQAEAVNIASELALPGSAEVLMPHIVGRLAMEIRGGVPVVVVLDVAGKPSALTLDELKKEIAARPAFKPLIRASAASGGGASGGGSGGGATKKLSEMNLEERKEFQKRDPDGFARETALVQKTHRR